MIAKVYEIRIACSVEELWEFHSDAKALKSLTPPGKKMTPVSTDLAVRKGAIHELKFSVFGIPGRWVAEIVEASPPSRFVDLARKSPFAYWRHTHEFLPTDERGVSLLRDTVEYKPPLGLLGALANRLFISKDIDAMFAYRHAVTKDKLERER